MSIQDLPTEFQLPCMIPLFKKNHQNPRPFLVKKINDLPAVKNSTLHESINCSMSLHCIREWEMISCVDKIILYIYIMCF